MSGRPGKWNGKICPDKQANGEFNSCGHSVHSALGVADALHGQARADRLLAHHGCSIAAATTYKRRPKAALQSFAASHCALGRTSWAQHGAAG